MGNGSFGDFVANRIEVKALDVLDEEVVRFPPIFSLIDLLPVEDNPMLHYKHICEWLEFHD